MNRRILISEDERSRILGLHENRKKQEWNLIFEQDNTGCASVPELKNIEDEKKFRGWVKQNYGTEKITVGGATNSPNAQVSPGRDFIVASPNKFCTNVTSGIWGAKPASGGGKTLGELYLVANPATPTSTGSATGTTFAIDNKPTVLNTDQEITDMVKNKKITAETLVFKSPEIPTWTKISALPEDNPIKKAVMAIIATVPPDLPGETKTFKISPDGKQPAKDYTEEQLTAAIKDGSLTQNSFVVVTDQATGKSSYQSIMQNPDASKIVNLASGPAALQQEMPSTGNKTLDEWLKTQAGQTYLSKPDRPAQEAFIDYLEQSGDPIIASVGGKEALRKILLGDVNKDTKFGRWLQRGGNKFKNVGKVLRGQNVVANTGYNPKRP
jgi:hypothetical protein